MGEHLASTVELAGIEVLDLGPQRHLELDALVHALDGKADVVGDRDQGRRGDGDTDQVQGLLGQGDVLGRYGGDQPAQRVGVSAVGRLEDPDHLERVDLLPGPRLEAEAASGEHDLGAVLTTRQDDVVVEDPQDLHVDPLPRTVVMTHVRAAGR